MKNTNDGKTLKLAAPIANVGDAVLALNYRKRPPEWEEGTIGKITYTSQTTSGSDWYITYDVFLDRLNCRGRYMWLYVSHVRKHTR